MTNDRNYPERWPDGVEARSADAQVLAGYEKAREQLARFQAPLLVGASNPHGRVFVAAFDGTGNDKLRDPEHITNVGMFSDQIDAANNPHIKTKYQPGVGTQDSDVIQGLDGALGYSYGPRMEQMYYDFCVQAKAWRDADPKAEISVAATGFSRGAVTAALFTRMVEERGIQDPMSMIVERGPDGAVTKTTPTRPPLVPPGQTPQVVGLFDPVATGVMDQVDVRLPPSVVSGFQITALDEHRDQFKSKQIIDPGMSADGRFLAVQVGGAHSDIGGSYLLNGLAIRNGNLMAAYFNATSDRPFLPERPVPTAPEMNVIHDSAQHQWFYTATGATVFGERQSIERLTAPAGNAAQALYERAFSNTDNAEPRNETLNRSLRYQHVPVRPKTEDPSLPDFYREHQTRLAERAAVEANNRNFVSPAEPLVLRDSEARGEYDFREQLQRATPYLTPEVGQVVTPVPTPIPSAPLPGIGAPLSERPQTQTPGIPILDALTVRLGSEPTQGPSSVPLPGIGAPLDDRSQPQASTSQPAADVRQVATLQTGLIQLGYAQRISQPLQVNGTFDDATRQAVTAFQAQQNLPITSSFDAATQQALQQALLAQQQIAEQRQTEDKTRQDERKSEQTRAGERDAELLPYSDPHHREHQIYATLADKLDQRGQLQEVSKEQLHGMAAQMHWEGFKPDWQGDAMVRGGRVIAQDTQGHRAAYDLRQPTQSVDATMQEVRDVDRQMAQVQEAHRQQDLTRPPPGPGQPGGPPLP